MLEFVRITQDIGRLQHTEFWLSNSKLGVPSPLHIILSDQCQVTLVSGSSKPPPGQRHHTHPVGSLKGQTQGKTLGLYYYIAVINKAVFKEKSCILNFRFEALSLSQTGSPRESWWGRLYIPYQPVATGN